MDMIRFSSKAGASVTLQTRYAGQFIHLMGHSGAIPGAILAEDVGAALEQLRHGLANAQDAAPDEQSDEEEREDRVSLSTRAYSLLQLLEAARKKQQDLYWEHFDGTYI